MLYFINNLAILDKILEPIAVKNTKIVKLLCTFSKTEMSKFRDFVNSPYFNKNKNVTSVAEAIISFSPEYNGDDFTEEAIFAKTFRGDEFDYFKIKNIISDIYQLALDFLKTSAVQNKEVENEIDLLNELHLRKLDNIYLQREKKVKGILESSDKDERYYYAQYLLAKVNVSHFKFEKTGYTFNQIQTEFDSFLDHSLTCLLRFYSKMLHNKNHGNIRFDMKMFNEIWQYAAGNEFENNPSCQIYKQIISLELTRDGKEYRKLLQLKEKYNSVMSKEDIYYILLIINSFAAYRLNRGDESYHNDRFKAFKEMAERNFFNNHYLYPNFITTYTSACMAGEFEWAEKFKTDFEKGILPLEEKTNSINYCNAFLAYRMKEYDKALAYFARTNFKLFLFKVMVRSYTMRIFYEKNMYEQLLSGIDSFRHYLKSEDQIAETQKAAHYDFLIHLKELAELKNSGISRKNSFNLTALKRQIKKMESNPLGTKNWLIEKANEL
jgi:hypothetical protein